MQTNHTDKEFVFLLPYTNEHLNLYTETFFNEFNIEATTYVSYDEAFDDKIKTSKTKSNSLPKTNDTQSGGQENTTTSPPLLNKEIIHLPYNFFYNKMKYLSDAYNKVKSTTYKKSTPDKYVNTVEKYIMTPEYNKYENNMIMDQTIPDYRKSNKDVNDIIMDQTIPKSKTEHDYEHSDEAEEEYEHSDEAEEEYEHSDEDPYEDAEDEDEHDHEENEDSEYAEEDEEDEEDAEDAEDEHADEEVEDEDTPIPSKSNVEEEDEHADEEVEDEETPIPSKSNVEEENDINETVTESESPNVITITIPKVGHVEQITIDTIGYNPVQWRIVQYLLKHNVKWLDMEVWEMEDNWIAIGAVTNLFGRPIAIDPKISNILLIKQIIESEEE